MDFSNIYNDAYVNAHDKRADFFEEVRSREENTRRIVVKSKEITVGELCEGTRVVNGTEVPVYFFVYLDKDKNGEERKVVKERIIRIDCEEALKNTLEKGTCLAIKVGEGKDAVYYPLSDVIKTSLNGRTGESFNGELSENLNVNNVDLPIPPMVLAKVYDTLLKRVNSTLKLIVAYGKVQAIMSSRYSPISQQAVFDAVENECKAQGYDCSFYGGTISHRATSCFFAVSNERLKSKGYSIGIAVDDSSTGFSGVHLYIIVMKGDIKVGFDDSYSTKHVGLNMEDIPNGVKACLLKLEDNANKIIDSMLVTLSNPYAYIKNAYEELNKLVKRMPGATLNAEHFNFVKDALDEHMFLNNDVTLYDIIEMFWEIPKQFKQSSKRIKNPDDYEKKLEKTVSRILILDHAKLDQN